MTNLVKPPYWMDRFALQSNCCLLSVFAVVYLESKICPWAYVEEGALMNEKRSYEAALGAKFVSSWLDD